VKLPTLEQLLALRESARYLSLKSRSAVGNQLHGGHRSAHGGRGLEFQEVRLYAAGDDARAIDWRVTARRGRPHTKLFHEERERPVWLAIDLDAALFFGTRRQLKSAVSVLAAALLAWTAAKGGDRIGAVIGAQDECRILPPRMREAGVLPVLESLIEMQPQAPNVSRDEPCFSKAIQTLAPLVRPGSLVLALSDFAAPKSTDEALWSRLAARAECRLFWITDPLEEHGLPDGRFRVGAQNQSRILDGASIRQSWLAAWRARQTRVGELTARLGIAATRLDTQEPTTEALQSLLRAPQSVA